MEREAVQDHSQSNSESETSLDIMILCFKTQTNGLPLKVYENKRINKNLIWYHQLDTLETLMD